MSASARLEHFVPRAHNSSPTHLTKSNGNEIPAAGRALRAETNSKSWMFRKPESRHYTPENSLQHGSRTVRFLLMCGAGSLSLGVWWADRAAYRGKHLHSRGRSRGTRTQNRWTSGTWRTTNTPCLSTRHPTWRLFLSSSARAAAASRPFGGTERRRAVGSVGSVSKQREVGWEMGTSRRLCRW